MTHLGHWVGLGQGSKFLTQFHLCAQVKRIQCSFIGTVDNHVNTEIMETVIFIKCREFAKMP